ncbi:MhpC Predicted hydrolases or acyltransferases (alpha/beta hydrolase superfamily) [Comamonadaceae bacterium]
MSIKKFVFSAVAFFAASFASHGQYHKSTDVAPDAPLKSLCTSPKQSVRDDRFVAIGGIEQWITIRGDSCVNPIVLFLHGGPGNTLSPYADVIYGPWTSDFTLVQWDQRGAGRTFGRNPTSGDTTLTLDRMARDGVELAEYLGQLLGKRKIILVGGSWGSILGVQMVKAKPDLFYAYVGVSQVVNFRDNLAASYTRLMALVIAKGDRTSLSAMESMGPPPWVNPRYFGVLRRISRTYEAAVTTPAPSNWWVRQASYNTLENLEEYEAGEEYSFLQFIGAKGNGMFSRVDLRSSASTLDVPLFLIHGAQDLVAIPAVAQSYFDRIKAPSKEFVIVPMAGHDLNSLLVDALYQILVKKVLPLAQQ